MLILNDNFGLKPTDNFYQYYGKFLLAGNADIILQTSSSTKVLYRLQIIFTS